MIDIHTHILPYIDDGADSWDETMEMLRQAENDGISGIVCTSHVLYILNKEIEEIFIEKFQELKKRAGNENINLKLYLASEININAKFEFSSPIATINGEGKYMVLELPMNEFPNHAGDLFFQLSLKGIVPILVHPERNAMIIQRPDIVDNLVKRGVLIQVNSGSITGIFGRRIRDVVFYLLVKGLVHVVASDCHGLIGRPPILSDAFKIVDKKCGRRFADQLFNENPYKIIAGEAIDLDNSQYPVCKNKGKIFLKRLF